MLIIDNLKKKRKRKTVRTQSLFGSGSIYFWSLNSLYWVSLPCRLGMRQQIRQGPSHMVGTCKWREVVNKCQKMEKIILPGEGYCKSNRQGGLIGSGRGGEKLEGLRRWHLSWYLDDAKGPGRQRAGRGRENTKNKGLGESCVKYARSRRASQHG